MYDKDLDERDKISERSASINIQETVFQNNKDS